MKLQATRALNWLTSTFDRTDRLLLLLIFFGILGTIFSSMPIRKGDATEYVLTTESMFFEQNIEYNQDKYLRHLALKPSSMDGVGYVRNRGRDGKEYLTQHPLYYSLISTPLYGIFYIANHKLAYWSFFVTNLILFQVVAVYLLYYLKRKAKATDYRLLFFGYLFFSTAFGYIFWQHPETLLFFAVASFFFFLFVVERPLLASLFLGLSIGQSIVLLFLGLNLMWYFIERRQLFRFKTIIAGLIVVVIASFHYLVSYWLTGQFFPLSDNAKFQLSSLKDLLPALVDPGVGLVWFYPMVIFSLIFAKKSRTTLLVCVTVLMSLALYMVNRQFYTHQIGLRYHNYLYPAFFFILDPLRLKRRLSLQSILLIISAFLTIGINTDIRLNNDSMNISAKNFVGYKFAKRLFPFSYQEHPAVFINHTYYLTDYITYSTEHDPNKTKMYLEGNNYYSDINYFYPDKWLRTLFTPLEVGKLEFEFTDPNKSVTAKIGKKIFKGEEGLLSISIADEDLKSSQKGDMYVNFTRYAYIDWYFEGSCACELYPTDQRQIGNQFKSVRLNGRLIYPPAYTLPSE